MSTNARKRLSLENGVCDASPQSNASLVERVLMRPARTVPQSPAASQSPPDMPAQSSTFTRMGRISSLPLVLGPKRPRVAAVPQRPSSVPTRKPTVLTVSPSSRAALRRASLPKRFPPRSRGARDKRSRESSENVSPCNEIFVAAALVKRGRLSLSPAALSGRASRSRTVLTVPRQASSSSLLLRSSSRTLFRSSSMIMMRTTSTLLMRSSSTLLVRSSSLLQLRSSPSLELLSSSSLRTSSSVPSLSSYMYSQSEESATPPSTPLTVVCMSSPSPFIIPTPLSHVSSLSSMGAAEILANVASRVISTEASRSVQESCSADESSSLLLSSNAETDNLLVSSEAKSVFIFPSSEYESGSPLVFSDNKRNDTLQSAVPDNNSAISETCNYISLPSSVSDSKFAALASEEIKFSSSTPSVAYSNNTSPTFQANNNAPPPSAESDDDFFSSSERDDFFSSSETDDLAFGNADATVSFGAMAPQSSPQPQRTAVTLAMAFVDAHARRYEGYSTPSSMAAPPVLALAAAPSMSSLGLSLSPRSPRSPLPMSHEVSTLELSSPTNAVATHSAVPIHSVPSAVLGVPATEAAVDIPRDESFPANVNIPQGLAGTLRPRMAQRAAMRVATRANTLVNGPLLPHRPNYGRDRASSVPRSSDSGRHRWRDIPAIIAHSFAASRYAGELIDQPPVSPGRRQVRFAARLRLLH